MAYYMEDYEVTKVSQIIKTKFNNDVIISLSRESERLWAAHEKARKEHTEESYKAAGKIAYGIEMYVKALQDAGAFDISDQQRYLITRYYQFEVPARIRGKA